jgi:catecholate siderophore receptor
VLTPPLMVSMSLVFQTRYATSANPVGVDGGDGSEAIGQAYMDLDPEESRTFEIGTKWDVLNERLSLTAAVFRTEKQNTRIQLDAATYTNGGLNSILSKR